MIVHLKKNNIKDHYETSSIKAIRLAHFQCDLTVKINHHFYIHLFELHFQLKKDIIEIKA